MNRIIKIKCKYNKNQKMNNKIKIKCKYNKIHKKLSTNNQDRKMKIKKVKLIKLVKIWQIKETITVKPK